VQKHGGGANEFGDEVLSVDVLAEGFVQKRLAQVAAVKALSSEEHPTLKVLRDGGPTPQAPVADSSSGTGCVCVTFDPLDGSSVVDSNFSVGSIFALWPGKTPVGLQVRDLLCSVVCVYGPRTTLFVAHPQLSGVFEYMLFSERDWGLVHRKPHTIAPVAKIFSPGNLRAASISDAYFDFVARQMRPQHGAASAPGGGAAKATGKPATLRYTGAMVPDCMQILVKKSGIFITPAVPPFVVKLRMTFEVAPIGVMLIVAGGAANLCQGGFENLLDVEVTGLDQRASIAAGSAQSVQLVVAELKRESAARQQKSQQSKL